MPIEWKRLTGVSIKAGFTEEQFISVYTSLPVGGGLLTSTDITQKVVFRLALYAEEVNLHTFVMI